MMPKSRWVSRNLSGTHSRVPLVQAILQDVRYGADDDVQIPFSGGRLGTASGGLQQRGASGLRALWYPDWSERAASRRLAQGPCRLVVVGKTIAKGMRPP